MNKIRNIVIILIFLFAVSAQSTEYYVNGISGNDSNPGTIGSPWKTVGKANATLQAGDIVYIRAGTYTISSGNAIDPTNTGTSGNLIVFSAYNGEAVTFNYTGSATTYAVDLNSDGGTIRSYIKIHGISFTNFNKHLWILKGDHNEISSCSFIGFENSSRIDWRGSTIYRDARYNHVHDCTFGEFGYFSPNDNGVVFELGNEATGNDSTSYNLIEDNHFYHGGHHVLGMNGHHNIIRNNYLHNEAWSNYDGTDYGNRIFFMVGFDGDDYRNLIEGNRIAYGGEVADAEIGGSGGTLASSYNIIRKNMFYHTLIYGFKFEFYPGQSNCLYNYVYNNTFWHNGHSATGPEKDGWFNFYSHGLYFDQEDATTRDNRVKNNIFYDNKNATDSNEPIIAVPGGAPVLQVVANNWKGGVDGDPQFVNISGTPDPMNKMQFDFHLKSSSGCINSAGFLTTITSSDGSGTEFQVADAGYFMDGWGIVDADSIQLDGQSQTATITNVNYDANTLTVDTPLTWTNGQGITLAYIGSAPDLGAHESRIVHPSPQTPQNLQIVK